MNSSTTSGLRYEDVLLNIRKAMRPLDNRTVFMHPDVIKHLAKDCSGSAESSFVGQKIFSSPYLPAHPKKWEFPKDPFVDYEESDEAWARPVNFGREVDDKSKYVGFAIDSRYLML